MEKRILINNNVVPVANTKTKFLTSEAVNAPTPSWATWMFRVVAILTTALAFYVAGTSLVQEQWKVEVLLGLKAIDMLTLGFSKLFGLVEK